jgi:osmotically-inducible protein OsmY
MNELLRLRTALALAVSLGLALPGMASAADDIRGDDAAATEHSDDMYGEDTTTDDADDMRGGDTAVIEEDRQPLDEAREKEPMAGAEPEDADEEGGPVRDAWVKSKLESSYALDDNLSALDIDTDVDGGHVTLSGTVASEDQRQMAEEVALGIEGVSAVDNQLMVAAEAGTPEAVADDDSGSAVDDDSGSAVGDSWVKSKLESSYAVNDDLSALDIDTDVEGGHVTLSGTVASEDQRQMAEEVALGIEGVSAVDNQLMVEADAGTTEAVADDDSGSAVGDAALTAQVKSKLIGDDSIEGTDIDVDTQGSVVTLRGRVSTEEQRTRALELAREVDDVQSVQDELVVMADD